MMFDPMYFLFIAAWPGAVALGELQDQSAFNKYSKVRAATGLTGAQAAQRLLAERRHHRRQDRAAPGTLSDHYNPVTKTLALSEQVYGQPSVAAIGVACHEAGHAIQHAEKLRAAVAALGAGADRATSARASATS